MSILLTAITAAAVSSAAFVRFRNITDEERKKGFSISWFMIAIAVYMLTDITSAYILHGAGRNMSDIFSLIIAENFLFLLAAIDLKHRKIPNIYVLSVFVLKTVMIVLQGVFSGNMTDLFIRSLAGMAAGAFITGSAYLISGKGIGSGDVKMFAAVGYITGGFTVIDALVYSTVLCALCGIILIAAKKCSTKDCIPMAPFAYAGVLICIYGGM